MALRRWEANTADPRRPDIVEPGKRCVRHAERACELLRNIAMLLWLVAVKQLLPLLADLCHWEGRRRLRFGTTRRPKQGRLRTPEEGRLPAAFRVHEASEARAR